MEANITTKPAIKVDIRSS